MDWTSLLPVLGVEARGVSLPAVACCPLCHRPTLHVYNDPARVGQWYWCPGCAFAGDSVGLTAAAGDISIESAALKLAAVGFAVPAEMRTDAALARLAARHARQAAVRAFWDRCRGGAADAGSLAVVQRRLGIPVGVWSRPEWRRRAGRFIGRTTRMDVEELFRPGALAYRRRLGRTAVQGSGWAPIFPGTGWGDLLAVAYHDVPGRVRGFLFVGREGRPEDLVFKAIDKVQVSGRVGGLAMLEAIATPHPEFGDEAFSVEDPVLALRLQVRHLAAADVPLPIVSPWPGRERDDWGHLLPRTVVTWADGPDPRTISRARKCSGLVAEAPDRKALLGHAERGRPLVALRAMRESARPWDDTLERALVRLPPARAEELVLGLGLSAAEASGFLRACGDDTRARLAALFSDVGRPRGVTVASTTIVEAGGEWKIPKTGELVLDAVLRLETVIRYKSGRKAYSGHVEYRGQRVPFCTPAEEVEKDTLGWIQGLVAGRKLGEVVGTPRWSRHLLTIARQLDPPRAAEGIEVVGWDEGRNAFLFPGFILDTVGEVSGPDYVLSADAGPRPAAELVPPAGLTPGARTALAWGDEATELFWAVAACLIADLVAPALGLPRTSTALVGRGAWIIGGATAAAFGCLELTIPDWSTQTPTRSLRKQLAQHLWPAVVRRSYTQQKADVSGRLLAQLPPGLVARTSDWVAAGLQLRGGWNVVTAQAEHLSAGKVADHGRDILPNYLKDLCARRLRLDPAGGLVAAVHRDLAEWYAGQAAARPAWRATPLEVDDPACFAGRVARLVNRMLADGELRLLPRGSNSPHAVARMGDDRLHVPKWGFGEVLDRKGAPAIEPAAITRGLREAGVLLEERDLDYVPGWVVSEGWLGQHTYEPDRDQHTARGG